MSQIHWLNPISGSFTNAADWQGGTAPGASDDAILNAVGSAFTVTSAVSETVNSIQLAANATLDITGGTFDAMAGTGAGANAGVILVGASDTLSLGGVVANGLGAIIGTVMVGNVFLVIIPNQTRIVAAMRAILDSYGDRLLIGEIYLPFDQLAAYYGQDLKGAQRLELRHGVVGENNLKSRLQVVPIILLGLHPLGGRLVAGAAQRVQHQLGIGGIVFKHQQAKWRGQVRALQENRSSCITINSLPSAAC